MSGYERTGGQYNYLPGSQSDVALGTYDDKSGRYNSVPTLSSSRALGSNSKRGLNKKWIAIGAVAGLIAIGAIVGGVVGSRASKNDAKSNSAADNARNQGAVFSLDENSQPIYPSSLATVPGVSPGVTDNNAFSCGGDPFVPTTQDAGTFNVRPDHPRLVGAPAYRWQCLRSHIPASPYLSSWNQTIFANASRYAAQDPIPYTEDGGLSGSGVLDPAREIQLRIKHWAYAWRMSNDSTWSQRAWQELQTASGNNSAISFGTAPDRWNAQGHFLDCAEFTAAFAIAYDWMYDAWTPDQRTAIMWSIINLGLNFGLQSYTNSQAQSSYGWWQSTNGNWNCVCNKGLTLGALAIAGDDPTGVAQQILSHTVSNALGNCYQAVQNDGTWSETPDYWYFGSTSAAELWSSVVSATGYDHGIQEANPDFAKTGYAHIYANGFVEKFSWGDCGPNKYTATANSIMYYGEQFDLPAYTLYQRDRADAPEPYSMFWYNPNVTGDWWDGLPLDRSFEDQNDTWTAMRGSWTDSEQIYAAVKAGRLVGHQTHGNLDVGTFVFEALGERWAGELCQAQYLSEGYFSSEGQDSQRWLYYRTRTEGQNTLMVDYANQLVTADPPLSGFGTTNDTQNTLASLVGANSAAYWVTDMSSAYSGVQSISRGMRLLNSRRQMLLQDELAGASGDVQWRMHTNATITYANNNQTANLALNGKNLQVQILSPSGASFATLQPVRLSSDPALPSGNISQDLPNPGVSVLSITLTSAANQTIQVLFNPQWPSYSSFVTPSSVPLSSWSLTSHNT